MVLFPRAAARCQRHPLVSTFQAQFRWGRMDGVVLSIFYGAPALFFPPGVVPRVCSDEWLRESLPKGTGGRTG
jgi:hypothetical protein